MRREPLKNTPSSSVIIIDAIEQVDAIEIELSREQAYKTTGGTMVSSIQRDQSQIRAKLLHGLVVRHPEAIAIKTGVTLDSWNPLIEFQGRSGHPSVRFSFNSRRKTVAVILRWSQKIGQVAKVSSTVLRRYTP